MAVTQSKSDTCIHFESMKQYFQKPRCLHHKTMKEVAKKYATPFETKDKKECLKANL